MFRKYPGGQIIFIYIYWYGAGSSFEVSNVRLSTKVVVLGQYRIYFGAMGLKDFYFGAKKTRASKLYPHNSELFFILRLFLITPVFIIIVFVGKFCY